MDPMSIMGMTSPGSASNLRSTPAPGAAAGRLPAADNAPGTAPEGAASHSAHQQMGTHTQIMSMLLGLMGNQRQDG